ncbi:MAG: hypothetical protein EOP04_25055 [Proteobacteria bacterium]|nr:MAG: hypothetical protein EOP04_25055 [Pseudomonadota bacterium]
MKIFGPAILSFFVLASTEAFSADIYTSSDDDLSIITRFTDVVYDHVDGRETAKEFCYVGNAQDVCAAVQKDSEARIEDYMNGGHDAFEVLSCQTEDGVASVEYRMFSDYTDDVTKTETVSSCGTVDSKAKATIFQSTFSELGSELHIGTYRGVYDSGRTNLCFIGDAKAVCSQIKSDLALTSKEYAEGAHNYQELNSCVLDEEKNTVSAGFTIFHDWVREPVNATHTIKACLN